MKTIKAKFDDIKNGDWLLLSNLSDAHDNKEYNVIGRVTDLGTTWLHKHPFIDIICLIYRYNPDDMKDGSVYEKELRFTKHDKKEFVKIVGNKLQDNYNNGI